MTLITKHQSMGLSALLAGAVLASSAATQDLEANRPTGRMKSAVRRRAAVVAANSKQTAEQVAWNNAVEARKRAKKAGK